MLLMGLGCGWFWWFWWFWWLWWLGWVKAIFFKRQLVPQLKRITLTSHLRVPPMHACMHWWWDGTCRPHATCRDGCFVKRM